MAAIDATVVAGGNVVVLAKENLGYDGIAGTAAGGVGAIGASILIANLDAHAEARVGSTASITAGGFVGIGATTDETTNGLAFAGEVGLVAIGAQVVVINDSSAQNAHVDDGASIPAAPGGIAVAAIANRNVTPIAAGGALAGVAAGAAVAVGNVSGDTTATIGNVAIGGGGTIGALTVGAISTIDDEVTVVSVEAGIGVGLGAAVGIASVDGQTKASSGAHGPVAGNVSVNAKGTTTANVSSANVATGLLSAGVTAALATDNRSTIAVVTPAGNTSAGGSVRVTATSVNRATATAPGGSLGGISVVVMVPIATVSGSTEAHLNGSAPSSTSVTVTATSDNLASAEADILSISIGGVSGAFADAEITSTADTEATVGAASTIGSTGDVLVEATTTGSNNTATATAKGLSGGIVASVAIMGSKAVVDGAVLAELDGHVTGSTSVTVHGASVDTATAETLVASVGFGFSGAGAGALADIGTGATTSAVAKSTAVILSSGVVLFNAASTNTASATSDVASGGLVGLGVSLPEALVEGATRAEVDGKVGAGAFGAVATGQNTAKADADILTAGLITGAGASVDAEVTSTADVLARVGSTAIILVLTNVLVGAGGTNLATATPASGSLSLIGITILLPTAKVGGAIGAELDGVATALLGWVRVISLGLDTATATATIDGFSLLVGGNGVSADAEILTGADITAGVGSTATIFAAADVFVDAEQTKPGNSATAAAHSITGGGLISAGIFLAKALVGGATTATLNGNVTGSSTIVVLANGMNASKASTSAFGLGAFSITGAGVDSEVTSSADVNAIVGTGSLTSSGAISVTATSQNTATATSDAANGGIVAGGVSVPTAEVAGGTTAELGANVTSGTTLDVTATGTNTATADSALISIGLFAGGGAAADAEVTAAAVVNALVDASAAIAVSGAITITATGVNSATATPTSAALSAISISILLPTAKVGAPTKATMDGTISSGQSLTVLAQGQDTAIATADIDNFGLLASGSGASADAEILTGADIVASVASSASITVGFDVLVEATIIDNCQRKKACTPPGNLAQAHITSTGGGFIDAGIYFAKALDGGAVKARLDGAVLSSTSIAVTAIGKSTADARSSSFGLGAFTVSVAQVDAEITSAADTNATTGTDFLISSGFVAVESSATNLATAFTDAANVGVASGGVGVPTAKVAGGTLAELGAKVGAGDEVDVIANATNTATADSALIDIGLLSGGGAAVDAEVTSSADVNAIVDASAIIIANGDVTVSATSVDHATATPSSAAVSLFDITVLLATAKVGGGTLAEMDGDVEALGLTVKARGQNIAIATVDIFGFSLLASGQGASADAEILTGADVVAQIGSSSTDVIFGSVLVDAGLTADGSGHENYADAETHSTGVGAIHGGFFLAQALVGGAVHAELDGSVGGTDITVTAAGKNDAEADTSAFGLGLFSVGGTGVDAEVTSTAGVSAIVGTGNMVSNPGDVTVGALSNNIANATSDTASGGLLSIGVNIPTAKVAGGTTAEFGATAAIFGNLIVGAIGTNTATATTSMINIGFFSGGGASVDAEVTPTADVAATVDSAALIGAAGTITIGAVSTDHATASPSSASGGLFDITILLATAKVGGATTAAMNGTILAGASLLVRARGQNFADAHSDIHQFELLGAGQGASSDAEILTGANVVASTGVGSSITVAGDVTIDAGLHLSGGHGNYATAETNSAGGGLIDFGIFYADAEIGGAVTARLNGDVLNASSVTVVSNGVNDAIADTSAFGLGAFAASGSGVNANVTSSGDVNATVGSGTIVTTGGVSVTATSDNFAHATSDAAGGGIVAGGVTVPTAKVAGGTTAGLDATVTKAKSVTVSATGSNIALAETSLIAIGFITGGGASVDAEVTAAADVIALIGPDANITITGPVEVLATSVDHATATPSSASGGLFGITVLIPKAIVGGATGADMDGTIASASSLLVQARGQNIAVATADIHQFSLLAGGQGASSDAEILTGADVVAQIGPDAFVSVRTFVRVDSGLTPDGLGRENFAGAETDSTGGGLINAGIFFAKAIVGGAVNALMNGAILSSGSVTIVSAGLNDAEADSSSFSLGLLANLSGSGVQAAVTGSAQVNAVVDPAFISTSGAISISATSTNIAHATADTAGGGLISGGVEIPTATIDGGTKAELDAIVPNAASLDVTATGTNTATAAASIVTIGLLGGVGIGSSKAEITSGAVVQALIGSDAVLLIPGVAINVTARSTDTATANSGGGVGGAGLTITDMTAEADVGGGTWAYVADDASVQGGALTVVAGSILHADATDDVTNIGGISGSGESPTTSVTHVTQAFAGKRASIDLGGSFASFGAGSLATATSHTSGFGVGAIQISGVDAESTISSTTLAFVDDGTVLVAGRLTADAVANDTATATASSTGIGLASGTGATTRATEHSTVAAWIGPSDGHVAANPATPTKVTTRDGVNVFATLTAHPFSNADMTQVSLFGGGQSTTSTTTNTPTVAAYLGDKAQVSTSGDVLFRAVGVVTAIVDASGFGGSLGVSVAGGVETTADLRPTVRTYTTGGGSVHGKSVTFLTRVNVDSGGSSISPTYKAVTVAPSYATLTLGTLGLLGGGTGGNVVATDSPTAGSSVGNGTLVSANGAVTLEALVFQPAQADGTSFAGGLGVGIGIVVPTATSAGAVTSRFDGNVTSAGSVLILNAVEARTTTTGRSAAGGGLAGVTSSTLTADTHPNVQALVGGAITASGDVTVESYVVASAVGNYEGIQLSLGFSGGFVTVNATDGSHSIADVLGGASVTSSSGNVSLLAFHNFDGSKFLTDNKAEALASLTSAAIGADYNSSDLNATAQALTTAQLDPNGTLAALGGSVIVHGISGNFSHASMSNSSGALLDLGSVGSNPTATSSGNTQANLEGTCSARAAPPARTRSTSRPRVPTTRWSTCRAPAAASSPPAARRRPRRARRRCRRPSAATART